MGKLTWEVRDEAELVALARAGNLSAFDALVVRYRPAAVVIATHVTHSFEVAEDAVQDAFLAAYKALPQLAEPEKFAGWFGAIVRHRARRLSAGDRRVHVPLDDVILCHSPSILAEVEQRAKSGAIHCALSKLPDEIRPIMELYYLEEWSVGRIAEFIALPVTTVKWRLHAGRKLLRTSLSHRLEEPNE